MGMIIKFAYDTKISSVLMVFGCKIILIRNKMGEQKIEFSNEKMCDDVFWEDKNIHK